MSTLNQPLSQALSPRRAKVVPALLLAVGAMVALAAAAYGFVESRRTEPVVIAVRPVPYGQRIAAEDLGVIELPLHRPVQVAGFRETAAIVGQWAARTIGPNDVLQPDMLLATPPGRPVYPNGRELGRDMVPAPFSTASIGPLDDHDLVNVGFIATDPELCQSGTPPHEAGRAYACRFLTGVRVLYIEGQTAYLELTPYQAHALWALQAAGVQLWGERYGADSQALPPVARLDAGQIAPELLIAPPGQDSDR